MGSTFPARINFSDIEFTIINVFWEYDYEVNEKRNILIF